MHTCIHGASAGRGDNDSSFVLGDSLFEQVWTFETGVSLAFVCFCL